jgi:toxin CcdB
MAQFDVFQNPKAGTFPLLLDIQSELLARLETRVVVPMTTLKKLGAKPITRLNPVVKIDNHEYVLVVQDLASIPLSALSKRVTNIAAKRTEIIAALDLLITGI